MNSILIATTPRTGSWLLCGGLRQSGVAGRTEEYAGPRDEATWRTYHGFDTHAEYFSQLGLSLATANGVRSLKLMLGQYRQFEHDGHLYGMSGPTGLDMLQEVLGSHVVVRLQRRDVVAQAVSWFRASRTGEWSRTDGSVPKTPPEYDEHAILQAIDWLQNENAAWARVLARTHLKVMFLDYEDLCLDFDGSVRRVMRHAGIDVPSSVSFKPQLTRQADLLSMAWGSQIQAHLRSRGEDVPVVSRE